MFSGFVVIQCQSFPSTPVFPKVLYKYGPQTEQLVILTAINLVVVVRAVVLPVTELTGLHTLVAADTPVFAIATFAFISCGKPTCKQVSSWFDNRKNSVMFMLSEKLCFFRKWPRHSDCSFDDITAIRPPNQHYGNYQYHSL